MKKLISYILAGLLTIGALGLVSVFAQTDTAAQPAVQEPAIKGSITLTQDPMAQYLTLAKVSMADVVAAAQKAVGSTESASSASLEDANGYLVWAVVVAGQEVKVDAGTAEVLYQGAVNADEMNNGDEQGSNDEMNQSEEQNADEQTDKEKDSHDEESGDNENDNQDEQGDEDSN